MRSGWQSCRSTAVHNPQAFPSPTISRTGSGEEVAGALDGKIVSSEPTGTLIGQSAFLWCVRNLWEFFALYHGFFHLHGGEENYFYATVRRWSVDKVLDARGEYFGYDSRFRNLLRQSPGAPVHLVQGAHEETTGGQRTVYPLHLSEMHLPAHDASRVPAIRPPPGTLMPSSPLPLAARYETCLL